MADMLTKTNLFPPSSCYLFNRSQKEQQIGFISKSCKFKGFPLKAKPVQVSWRSQTTSLGSGFLGKEEGVLLEDRRSRIRSGLPLFASTKSQSGFRIGNAQKWWEKGLQPNMTEVISAQELVDSLTNAGDKLVVVAFFSPGCGGCRALHPKLCQLAEMNPEVQFLHVNYEEQKSMCYSLNVHVLPFFRFYRGAHGRLCSFSCTNATIKKFKDALAKHTPARCSLGPTKGLEEKELVALAANKDLSFTYTPKPAEPEPIPAEQTSSSPASHLDPSVPLPRPIVPSKSAEGAEEKTMVTAWR